MRSAPDPRGKAWSAAVLARDERICRKCKGVATDAHHIAARSQRPDLKYDLDNGVALCRECHNWVPNNVEEAKELGLYSDAKYEYRDR